jgi:hypothetical protein
MGTVPDAYFQFVMHYMGDESVSGEPICEDANSNQDAHMWCR